MRHLLATTAVALLAASPFAASAQTAATGIFLPSVESAMRVSTLMGKSVYVSEADVATGAVSAASGDWNNVGEVNDIVLGNAGDVQAVLVDVGGFLGIGEKTVAVNLDDIRVVPDSASPDNFFLVFKGSKADLDGAPAFKLSSMPAAGAATDGAMNGTAATDGMATSAEATATSPATAPADAMVAPEGMEVADLGTISAEKLIGADVRGADNGNVGEVGDLVMDGDRLSAVVVDVGGFLGIGEKPVALNLDQVKVWKDQSGTLVVSVNETKDGLKAMPAYRKP
jgi:hypothetical protein